MQNRTRRGFLATVTAILAFPFTAHKATAAHTDERYWIPFPEKLAPAITKELCFLEVDGRVWAGQRDRPRQTGIEGQTYFAAGTDQFSDTFPCKKLYIDGKNVHTSAFEVDLKAGWVGVWEHRFKGTEHKRREPLQKIWLYGTLTIR